MRENLVIVRAGQNSLHHHWVSSRRNWDLIVSWYGSGKPSVPGDACFKQAGTKWQGLYALLTSGAIDWQKYKYVWLPDDDLLTTCEDINLFFDLQKKTTCSLSQPSLSKGSFIGWTITMQHHFLVYRNTNFVEVMAPAFEVSFLRKMLPTFDYNASGWGLDFLWSIFAGIHSHSCHIFDRIGVQHTRPVGSAGHGAAGYAPREEWAELVGRMNKLNGSPIMTGTPAPTNYEFHTKSGKTISLERTPQQFLAMLERCLPLIDKTDPYFLAHYDVKFFNRASVPKLLHE